MALTTSKIKLNRGDTAPDFHLQGIDGKTYSLSDFREYEGLLLVFMCNHCPYVKIKVEALKKLYEEFKNKVTLVGINSNDPEFLGEGMEKMQSFAKEWGLEFPYLLDDSQVVGKTYGATCTPDPFLFDRERKLIYHGKINNAMNPDDTASVDTMRENIQKMLRGEKIEKWFDPSLGCSIKWKYS